MAAIDKIYVNGFEQYELFKNWCEKQPKLKDKYGVDVSITDYLYKYKEPFDGERVAFQAPYYIDAYVIKNCPFDFIQDELMVNYGHWSQRKIDEAYDVVKKRTEGDETPFYSWLTLDDFKIVDGVVTMPNLEKSDYDLIKEGKLYDTPYTNEKYVVGKHFKCTKHPIRYFNKPLATKSWFIDVDVPDGMKYMWYHSNHNSWDFSDEFVKCKWSSSNTFCGTIKSLKRLIIKWKLPIGTKITATGRYLLDTYEFIVKK
jgi:hypothetical protein